MEIKKEIKKDAYAVKITAEDNGKTVGRASLYIITNDLHQEPCGLMEDVFMEDSNRGGGVGTKLVQTVIDEAKSRGCYKLLATSRHERESVHKWYEKLGFKSHGVEFRMDFK